MTWILTIIGDCRFPTDGIACMVVPVTDKVHDHPAAADCVEQLVCEQFHDTYPAHTICDLCWVHEEEKT